MVEALFGVLGTSFLAVFGWAYTLSNRMLIVETSYNGLEELIESKFDEVNRRLQRIEDNMTGMYKGH